MKTSIVIGGILIVSLVAIQGFWFTRAYDSNANQFEHTVSVALYSVADTMSDQAIVEKRSSNYFYVKMGCPASNQLIDTLIRKEFAKRDLSLDYELGIYNTDDDSLVHGKYVAASEIIHNNHLTDKEIELCNKDFAVLFPKRQDYLLGQMDTWIYSSLILLLLSTVLFQTLNSKVKSAKIPVKPMIRLGHSQLDHHNQQLLVHGETIQLTYKENKILHLLFQHPNQVIERQVFLEEVWEKDGFFVERSMDVFISRIRKYLKADSRLRIENLRSIGYRLHVK
ncbi:MAG: winged helix-turn-helix transcriptional regulator [Cyclobacteriaceae bacterium]|nr:winged helix-turn-helix transcriptional regulator [Cyclobacteriaceae bacterium SS2]